MKRTLAILIVAAVLLGLTGAGVVWAAPEQWERHAVTRQAAVIYLTADGWSDPSVGTWDPDTRTATLTNDLAASIQVDGDDLILEGNGYSLSGVSSANGVTLKGRTNVTVQNLTVSGWANGFYLSGCTSVTLADNTAAGNGKGILLTSYCDETVLDGNSVSGNDHGIHLQYSDRITITGNIANQNRSQGIRIERSNYLTLADNAVDGNSEDGIYLERSHYNTLTGNTANGNGECGLRLGNSGSNTLTGNTMAGNGCNFRLEGETIFDYSHTIDNTNLVDGKAILYVRDATGGTYDASSNAGTVYLVNCRGVTVRNLTVSNNDTGVLLFATHDSLIENILATGNSTGIWLRDASGNTLSDNVCRSNRMHGLWLESSYEGCSDNNLTGNAVTQNASYGFYLLGASGNSLTGNTITDNGCGLRLEGASNNRIHNNRLISNRSAQAYASGGSGNAFAQPKPTGGNYWSNWTGPDADGDGFVDLPYKFTGGQDPFPYATDGSWTDNIAPTTTIHLAGLDGDNGWFRSAVEVTLSAVDNPGGSGVESTSYSLDGVNWIPYIGPFTIEAEGVTTVYYRSRDKAGNVEEPGAESTLLFDDFDTFDTGRWGDATYLPRYNGRPQVLQATTVDGRSVLRMRTAEVSPPGDARRGIGSPAIGTTPEMAVELAFKPVGDLDDLAELWLFNRSSGRFVRVSAVAGSYAHDRVIQAQIEVSGQVVRTSEKSIFSLNEWLIFRIESVSGKTIISLLDEGRNTRWSTTYDVALVDLFGEFNVALSQHLAWPYADTWHLTAEFDYVKVTKIDRASRSEAIKIDRTPPTVQFGPASPEPNAAGWNNTDVTVPYLADDTVSGVALSEPASPLVLTAEGRAVIGTVTVTDFAGNSTTVSSPPAMIDKTPPVVTGVPSIRPTEHGWYNDDVTVEWQAVDDLSGVDPTTLPAPTAITAEGAGQVAGPVTVTDLAGNTAEGQLSDINIDKTPPRLAFGAPSPRPNAKGWNNTDVSIPFTAADDLSGLAPDSPASPLLLTTEGQGVSEVVTVQDRAGNSTSLASPAANIDKTAPTITAAASTPAGEYVAGTWTNQEVTVSFRASDELAGVVAEPPPVLVRAEGGDQYVEASCSDHAGNTARATFGPINIDRTPPVLIGRRSPQPNPFGWNNTDVTVTFEASDGLSGLASLPGPTTVSLEGAGMMVIGTAVDLAGNEATATVEDINIDKTAPVVRAIATTRTGPYVAGTWTNEAVTVRWTASDELSGVLAEAAPVTLGDDGAGQSATGTCIDYAGNETAVTFGPINIDRTPPVLVGKVTPEPNAWGWNSTDVSVSFEAYDEASGLASVPGPTVVSMAGADMLVVGTAVDNAGNEFTASVTVNIDKTPPVPVIAVPEPNGVVAVGTPLLFDGVDDLSGVVSVVGQVTKGTEVIEVRSGDSVGPGVYVLTVEVTDAAGHSSRESRSFTVGRSKDYVAGSGTYDLEPGGGDNGKGKGRGNGQGQGLGQGKGQGQGQGQGQGKGKGKGNNKEGPEQAIFSFICRYQGSGAVPSSRWPLYLDVRDMSFRSTLYDWLVVEGAVARFVGSGTINGVSGYGFAVTAVDGKEAGDGVHRLRIRIWEQASGEIVYDNEPGRDPEALPLTEVSSGRIMVKE